MIWNWIMRLPRVFVSIVLMETTNWVKDTDGDY